MRFPTELRIVVDLELTKPRTFEEYIIDQIMKGRDINFRKKEAFDMLEALKEKRETLQNKLNNIGNHEEEIAKAVAEFESNTRKEYEEADKIEKNKLIAQIDVVNELITEQENLSIAEESVEQNEDCNATNELNVEGE